MAEMKPGRIVEWHRLSASLSLFRLLGPEGARFPPTRRASTSRSAATTACSPGRSRKETKSATSPISTSRPHGARSLRRGDGTGRANNMLRKVLGLPLKEEGALAAPPRERPLAMMQKRIDPSRTVVLTCGNPLAMADIAWIAA